MQSESYNKAYLNYSYNVQGLFFYCLRELLTELYDYNGGRSLWCCFFTLHRIRVSVI